jgi:hypothetical protein
MSYQGSPYPKQVDTSASGSSGSASDSDAGSTVANSIFHGRERRDRRTASPRRASSVPPRVAKDFEDGLQFGHGAQRFMEGQAFGGKEAGYRRQGNFATGGESGGPPGYLSSTRASTSVSLNQSLPEAIQRFQAASSVRQGASSAGRTSVRPRLDRAEAAPSIRPRFDSLSRN